MSAWQMTIAATTATRRGRERESARETERERERESARAHVQQQAQAKPQTDEPSCAGTCAMILYEAGQTCNKVNHNVCVADILHCRVRARFVTSIPLSAS